MDLFLLDNNLELLIIIYLIIINIVAFAAFGIDKWRSKTVQWRMRESFLFLLALLGGGSGSLIGMLIFHHKIRKKKFYIGIPIISILNRILEVVIFFRQA